MPDVIAMLGGGDRRSIGRAAQVVQKVLKDQHLLANVIAGLRTEDILIRMRCADVAEKVSVHHPEWLQPYKARLLQLAGQSREQEVRWHLAQMLPRLAFDKAEKARAIALMQSYLDAKSRIVATFALQALFELAQDDRQLRRSIMPLIEAAASSGTPAMRARARKLLKLGQVPT